MPVYTRAHKRKLRRESRTLPIFGKGDDAGRYFHCWHCGFVCDVERDALGDSDSSSGVNHTDGLNPVGDNAPGDSAGNHATLGGDVGHYHVAARIGADDDPKSVERVYTPDISMGCPFCGSTNWRGDY